LVARADIQRFKEGVVDLVLGMKMAYSVQVEHDRVGALRWI
jgi:hypothetical protein